MTVYKQDYEEAKAHLWPDEVVEVTATQRQFAPGGSAITPTTIVATDKRVIIINRASFGMRKDIESIPYYRITSVRFEKGIISSSVFLRIEGYTNPGGMQGVLEAGKEWGEIDGLKYIDAKAVTDFINKKLSELNAAKLEKHSQAEGDELEARHNESEPRGAGGNFGGGAGYIYCNECGFKNPLESHFCGECGHKMK